MQHPQLNPAAAHAAAAGLPGMLSGHPGMVGGGNMPPTSAGAGLLALGALQAGGLPPHLSMLGMHKQHDVHNRDEKPSNSCKLTKKVHCG